MCGFVRIELAPLPDDDPDGWAEALERRVRAIGTPDYPTLARHRPAMSNRAFILRWQNGTDVPLDCSFEAFIDSVIRGLASGHGPRPSRRGRAPRRVSRGDPGHGGPARTLIVPGPFAPPAARYA